MVFPVAALEQRDHHMPFFTDNYLPGEVVRRRPPVTRIGSPLRPSGGWETRITTSTFRAHPSAPPRAYLELLAALLENSSRMGSACSSPGAPCPLRLAIRRVPRNGGVEDPPPLPVAEAMINSRPLGAMVPMSDASIAEAGGGLPPAIAIPACPHERPPVRSAR